MSNALVPFDGQTPEPRRGILARVFGSLETQSAADSLRQEHALISLSIELNSNLKRRQRQANQYLEVTELEDKATVEVAKVLRCRELCDSVEDIFADDPMMAEILKVRVRAIFNGRNGNHHSNGRRRKR